LTHEFKSNLSMITCDHTKLDSFIGIPATNSSAALCPLLLSSRQNLPNTNKIVFSPDSTFHTDRMNRAPKVERLFL